MSIMIEAMRKAGLVSSEKANQIQKMKTREETANTASIRYQQWKSRSVKNRYGDIALFEIWEKTGQYPKNHRRKCCLCGICVPQETGIEWRAPNGKYYRMCDNCYIEERKSVHDNQLSYNQGADR